MEYFRQLWEKIAILNLEPRLLMDPNRKKKSIKQF